MEHDEPIGHYERPLVQGGQGRSDDSIRDAAIVTACLFFCGIGFGATVALAHFGYRALAVVAALFALGTLTVALYWPPEPQDDDIRGPLDIEA
jgi:hypothetical protein